MDSVISMVETYPNSPLVEAICDINFADSTMWDPTTIGLFYEKINKDFPNKSTMTRRECEGMSGEGCEALVVKKEYATFSSSDEKIKIIIGDKNLIVQSLKPYPSWKSFSTSIIQALTALNSILKSTELSGIRLYYYNIIEDSTKELKIGDFFNLKPDTGTQLPKKIIDFIIGCEFPFESNNAICRTTLTTNLGDNPQEGEPANYTLGINYFAKNPEKIVSREIPKWIEIAHNDIIQIFEGIITDSLRKKFERG